MLNNEMDDFAAKAGVPNGFRLIGADANAVAPGKRPLSSMTPTFIEKPDGADGLGSPGGSVIMTVVLLATLDWMDGVPPEEFIKQGRYHHQYMPDTITFEPGALTEEEKADAAEVRPHAARVAHAGQHADRDLGLPQRRSEGGVRSARRRCRRGLLSVVALLALRTEVRRALSLHECWIGVLQTRHGSPVRSYTNSFCRK